MRKRTWKQSSFSVPHGKTPEQLSRRLMPWKIFRVFIRPCIVQMVSGGKRPTQSYGTRPFEINVSGEILIATETLSHTIIDGMQEVHFDPGSLAVKIKRILTPGERIKHLIRRIGFDSVGEFFRYLRKHLYRIASKSVNSIEIWV